MKYLFWVASYPKSGNTWMRIFLANLQRRGDEPIDINTIKDYRASSRQLFDCFSGLEGSLLKDAEILHVMHQVYESVNAAQTRQAVLKTHAPYLCNSNGAKLFPTSVSQGAIYLVRNPLDVATSLANHNSLPIDNAIALMADDDYALCANRDGDPNDRLFEPVSTWSQNVLSWVEECEFPLLIIRYEDLILKTFESFSWAARFAGLSEDPVEIRQAIDHSSFDVLQKQEQARGFREKPENMGMFFRKGRAGSWPDELSSAQVARIIHDHGEVMRRFGYLTKDGTPIY